MPSLGSSTFYSSNENPQIIAFLTLQLLQDLAQSLERRGWLCIAALVETDVGVQTYEAREFGDERCEEENRTRHR